MAATDPWIRAKKDKPGHCCACNCMTGKWCERWWVLTATEIEHCGWLALETGVILKYRADVSEFLPNWSWLWQKTDDAIPIVYSVFRNAHPLINTWILLLSSGGCILRAIVDQEHDEQLWQGAEDIPFTTLGTCSGEGNSPIGTLSAKMYRTQAAALVDWPDLEVWDWS